MSQRSTPPAPDNRGDVDGREAPDTRRGLLAAGVAAALGALGVATAAPARAAAGQPLLVGRSNAAGTLLTALTSANPRYGFLIRGTAGSGALFETLMAGKWGARSRNVSRTSSGSGGAFLGEGNEGHGVYGTTRSCLRFGVYGRNTDSVHDSGGGAVRAEGRQNVGLFADTGVSVTDVPAVVAFGGDGERHGVALVAGGTSYLDGDALALRGYVGALGADGEVEYVPLASGEFDYHAYTGAAVLDGTGAATVPLPAAFVRTVTMSTLRVVGLTPVGVPMPDLHATVADDDGATGFGIAGGAASGTVHYTVNAVRLAIGLGRAAALAPASAASPPSARVRVRAAVSRVRRAAVSLPQR